MTALLDDLGTWVQLGTLRPSVGEWVEFTQNATQGWTTFRASYSQLTGKVYSRCYLRSFYRRGVIKVVGQTWTKIHPKPETEILTLPYSPEFQFQQVERGIEIFKFLPYWRTARSGIDPAYQVTLEEFVPYPETVAAIVQQQLAPAAIEQIAAAVVNRLNSLPPG